VKVYLDENLSSEIARLLRDVGVDAVSAHEARKRQVAHRAQLAFATAHDRVIVTADLVDFVFLSMQVIAANSQHAGIIVAPASFLRGSVVYLQCIRPLRRCVDVSYPQ